MKRYLRYTLIIFLLLIAIVISQNYPNSSVPKNFPRLADTSNIQRNLVSIINTSKSRNYQNVDVLDFQLPTFLKELSAKPKHFYSILTGIFPILPIRLDLTIPFASTTSLRKLPAQIKVFMNETGLKNLMIGLVNFAITGIA